MDVISCWKHSFEIVVLVDITLTLMICQLHIYPENTLQGSDLVTKEVTYVHCTRRQFEMTLDDAL